MYSYAPTSATGVLNPSTVPMNGSTGRINNNGASMQQTMQPGYATPYGVNQFGVTQTTPFGLNGINNMPGYNNTMNSPLCNSAYCNTPFVNNVPMQPNFQPNYGYNTPNYGYNSMPFAIAPTPFVGNSPFGFANVPTMPVAHPMSIAGTTGVPFNAPVQNIANPITGWNNTISVAPFGQFTGTPSVNSFYPQSIVNQLAGISSLGYNGIAPFGWNSAAVNGVSPFGLANPFIGNTVSPFGIGSSYGASSFVNPLTVPSVGAWNNGIASPVTGINSPVGANFNAGISSPVNTPWLGSNILNNVGATPFFGSSLPQQILAQQALACSLGGCNATSFGNSPFFGGLNTNYGVSGSPFIGGWNNTIPFGGLNNSVNPFVGGISGWNTNSATPFNNGVCDWNCCYN